MLSSTFRPQANGAFSRPRLKARVPSTTKLLLQAIVVGLPTVSYISMSSMYSSKTDVLGIFRRQCSKSSAGCAVVMSSNVVLQQPPNLVLINSYEARVAAPADIH